MMATTWKRAFVQNAYTHAHNVCLEWIVRLVQKDCNYKVVNVEQRALKGKSYVIKPFRDAFWCRGGDTRTETLWLFVFLTHTVGVKEWIVILYQVLCSALHVQTRPPSKMIRIFYVCVCVLLIMFVCLWIFGCILVTMRHKNSTVSHITTDKCTITLIPDHHPSKLKQSNKTNKLTYVEWHIFNFG